MSYCSYREKPTPTEVRTIRCPDCNAGPGQFCQGVRKQRKANHLERVRAFEHYRSQQTGS